MDAGSGATAGGCHGALLPRDSATPVIPALRAAGMEEEEEEEERRKKGGEEEGRLEEKAPSFSKEALRSFLLGWDPRFVLNNF